MLDCLAPTAPTGAKAIRSLSALAPPPAAIEEVLETLEPKEIQVRRPPNEEADERIYLLRIFPYRTLEESTGSS